MSRYESARIPALLALLVALGCGDDAEVEAFDGGPDLAAPDGGEADLGDGSDAGATIPVAATDGDLTLPFGLEIRATATRRFGEITVDDAVGSATYDGESHDLVVYERTDWVEAGQTLFQALMPRPEGWVVLWFYCQGDVLDGIYSESTNGNVLQWEPASGTCLESAEETTTRVTLPSFELPAPELFEGTSISGPMVEVGGATSGWVDLGASRFEVYPFEHVDCTACAMGGWRELHAMLVDPPTGRICFGIFYLYLDDPNRVDLTYSLSLPDLSDPAGHTMLSATWSHE